MAEIQGEMVNEQVIAKVEKLMRDGLWLNGSHTVCSTLIKRIVQHHPISVVQTA